MKRFIGILAAVSFFASCNHDEVPDYPIEPFIESADLKFVETPSILEPDSMILSFYFRDGDMDLGFNVSDLSDSDFPFHPINYFLYDKGALIEVNTKRRYKGFPALLNIPANQTGKLVSVRTRNKPGYDFLPKYLGVCIYAILDTLYEQPNENHYNIFIDYLVKQPDGSFADFDWRKDVCSPALDGRFPYLFGIRRGMSVRSGPFKMNAYSSKDGQLRYSMNSIGFKYLFGGKTIKLRVKIKDRALHDSNIIETNEIQI